MTLILYDVCHVHDGCDDRYVFDIRGVHDDMEDCNNGIVCTVKSCTVGTIL